MTAALVIGAGPAGLMAAEVLAERGHQVTLCDGKPSVGRKFLMAGKSGLNLTKDEGLPAFLGAFAEAREPLTPIIRAFDAQAVQEWARGLGQEVFTGSTGRVFPVAMKASPLLRAWLARLERLGVTIRTRWYWEGWDRDGDEEPPPVDARTNGRPFRFATPQGRRSLAPQLTVLAMGGASWARLGSDGAWAAQLAAAGIPLAPFAPANVGVAVDWSSHMTRHVGTPIKGAAWRAGPHVSRGEAAISAKGLEGGGIYSVSRGVREGHDLTLDLLPDLSAAATAARLARPRGKSSLSNHLRKRLSLNAAQIALVQEMARPLPDDPGALAAILKSLMIQLSGLHPLDEAISTAGGVPFAALDDGLMLRALPGTFVAGEMIDWEAPTGGYLISACLATGRWAALAADRWLAQVPRA